MHWRLIYEIVGLHRTFGYVQFRIIAEFGAGWKDREQFALFDFCFIKSE
jgi:hypothetical protein